MQKTVYFIDDLWVIIFQSLSLKIIDVRMYGKIVANSPCEVCFNIELLWITFLRLVEPIAYTCLFVGHKCGEIYLVRI